MEHYVPAPAPLNEKQDMNREAIEELLDAIYCLTRQVVRLYRNDIAGYLKLLCPVGIMCPDALEIFDGEGLQKFLPYRMAIWGF